MDDAALLQLPDDPATLRSIILAERAQCTVALKERDTVIAQRDESIQLLSQDNLLLRHRLAALLRSSYGPRAERFDPRQLLLFGLLVPRIESPAPASTSRSKPANRSKHGRQKLPGHLPRLPIEHDLSESEKNCPCCGEQRERIGQEKNEQLEHLPSNFVVLEHIRPKYACPHCNSGHCQKCDGNAHIESADKPQQPIEKGMAGPGLLAYVATSKLADHLPLYRLEQIFSRQQVHINRSTLSGWMTAAARVVEPLYKLMCDRVRQSEVLHTDDTTVPIQHEGHCRQGRLWTYVGEEHHPYIVYDFTPTRSGQGPLGWLGQWKGFLQADAYAGYDKLYARGDVTEVACWAHARRKFFDARESDPARSLWMLEMIRRLYAVEAEGKASAAEGKASAAEAAGRAPPERLAHRQSQSAPILEQIRLWLTEQQAQVLPRSPIAGAIGYALNQWPALMVYTTDSRLSPDNNVAERALRRVAVGRKNWLFAGHDESAQGQAVLWSLIASAQRHELDVQLYLRSVLAYLPAIRDSAEQLQNYLPDAWRRYLMAEQREKLNAHHAKLLAAVRS
jgi:transposase